jgi:replicative DNA helicase
LNDYKVYFELNINTQSIDFNLFSTFFFNERNPYLDDKSVIEYKAIIEQIANSEINEDVNRLIHSFEQQEFYKNLTYKLESNVPIDTVRDEIEGFITKTGALVPNGTSAGVLEPEMDLDIALEATNRENGLQWRLKCLREAIGGIVPSDFLVFCAYVGKGKTSFLASEVTYMAQQLPEGKSVLWFNNEGNWKKCLSRAYSATLNHREVDIRLFKEKAQEEYLKRMKGDKNKIRIIDIKGKSTRDIDRLVKKYDPGLIIIDMLDKVRGFEIYLKGESGATERFNQLYAWAEELSDIAPVIATSQLNGDGCNVPYPAMTNLRGSRVDKQGNATTMIVMGALEGNMTTRYLSTPKNKISGKEDWRQAVNFDPERSRFS